MFDLTGRVAVVTGGNGGIGLGLARALAQAGASVAIWGTNEEKNAKALAELESEGHVARAYRCDVSDEEQVVATHRAVVDDLGRVDTMIANAGISGASPIHTMALAEWRRVMAVNLDGAFLCFREAAAHMIERGEGGALVAISSTAAIHGAPRQQHYAASKAALLALTRGLAVELARYGIRANAILPGWTDTDMLAPAKGHERFVTNTVSRTPVRRWGVPADLGPAAVFLADPTNAFHTGDTVVVDGGYTIY
jgi:NAD(P)-dependent dehydrogenase (short-subunit alcohol dehydrogenase family)